MVHRPAYSVEGACNRVDPMTEHLRTTINVDDRPGDDCEVCLPVGISESQALDILEDRLPGLYRNRLYAARLDDAIRHFEARPNLAERLMTLLRQPGGIPLLRRHLAPFREPFGMEDPLTVEPDHQEGMR